MIYSVLAEEDLTIGAYLFLSKEKLTIRAVREGDKTSDWIGVAARNISKDNLMLYNTKKNTDDIIIDDV